MYERSSESNTINYVGRPPSPPNHTGKPLHYQTREPGPLGYCSLLTESLVQYQYSYILLGGKKSHRLTGNLHYTLLTGPGFQRAVQ
jgi:hypothetical protein